MKQDIGSIKTLLDKSKDVLVLLPQNPGPDSIAASLGLYLALEKTGKQTFIACSTPIDFSQYPLKKSEKISQKIGNKNLVISLRVDNRDSIDKVSYNLDEDKKLFNLIITPKKGANPLSSDAVSYSLAGARADLIFIVGAGSFEDLGVLYSTEPALFTDAQTVAINRLEPTPFANHHLTNPDSSSIAESMVDIIEGLGLTLDSDLSSNLLASIDVVTDKLQLPNVSASTFEAVAKLLRAGGTRLMLNKSSEDALTANAVYEEPQTAPLNTPSQEEVISGETLTSAPTEVPQDWLAPKIYKAPKK